MPALRKHLQKEAERARGPMNVMVVCEGALTLSIGMDLLMVARV